MLVVMLILTIIMAAFAPIMTKRKTADSTSSPWKYASNNSDIYYGLGSEQTAMIGQTSKNSSDSARFLITPGSSTQAHILFKNTSGTNLGKLHMLGNNLQLGGFTDHAFGSNETYNTFIGSNAGPISATSALRYNTVVGAQAWPNHTQGQSNTIMGYNAFNRSNGTTTSNSDAVNYNTAIGYYAMYGAVDQETVPVQDTAVGGYAGYKMDGDYTTALGYRAGYQMSGDFSTVLGYRAGENMSGKGNTALGDEAGQELNGQYNVLLGISAGAPMNEGEYEGEVTVGNENVSIGWTSGLNIIGDNNVFVGGFAGRRVQGNSNTTVGYGSGGHTVGDNNSSLGHYSGHMMTGDENIAIGYASGEKLSGSYNTLLGYFSGNIMSGDYNTDIGYYAGYGSSGDSNTFLGHHAGYGSSGDYNIFLGHHAGYSSGVHASGDYISALGFQSCRYISGGGYKTCIGYNAGPKTATSTITEEVWIGSSSATVHIPGTLDATVSSDKRLKNIGKPFEDGLEQIRELTSYNYTFKKDKEKTPQVGVMAQDLQKIFPDAVITGDDGYLRIRKDDMFYALINAVKQLDLLVQGLIDELKTALFKLSVHDTEIKKLQKENQELHKQNLELEKRIEALEKRF